MLSRVADSLYWMSRYLERAEHTVRMLDVNLGLTLDSSSTSDEGRWVRVLAALGNPDDVKWEGDFYDVVRKLAFGSESHASITACILAARENARQVREEISSEQWQQLNRMYHQATERLANTKTFYRVEDFLPTVLDDLHLFEGVTDTTMSHGEGWQFIQMGRYIERATATTMLLDVFQLDTNTIVDEVSSARQYLESVGLLRCCTAFEAYCKVYTADLTPERILEFLLLDPEFPHSVRFSIDSLQCALLAIQSASGGNRAEELHRIAGRLSASLGYASVDEILSGDVVAYLRNIQKQCQAVHETIYHLYVDYSIQTALAG